MGMKIVGGNGCPVFVDGVVPGSPAERAGIRPGDKVLAVDGTQVNDVAQTARLIQSNAPTKVSLTLLRGDKEIDVAAEREKRSLIYTRNGQKMISGMFFSPDTTQAEVDRMLAFDGRRFVASVFPTHYPANPETFYAGFEIFLLRDPAQAAVGGIEDGPASQAGAHWGDVLLSVNDVAVAGKTPSEIERMFSATEPAPMRLQIDRLGAVKTLEFHLEEAGEIARQNGKRFAQGQLVPIWATAGDLHCFLH